MICAYKQAGALYLKFPILMLLLYVENEQYALKSQQVIEVQIDRSCKS